MTPSSQRATTVHVLWGRSDRYQTPQFLGAWSDGLYDAWPEGFDERVEDAKRYFLDFGDASDGPWVFWIEAARIPEPDAEAIARAMEGADRVAS